MDWLIWQAAAAAGHWDSQSDTINWKYYWRDQDQVDIS